MSIGFEKVLLMQNPLNLESSQVIQTYVYEIGILNGRFSYSTAVGLFNSVVNLIILLIFNRLAKRTVRILIGKGVSDMIKESSSDRIFDICNKILIWFFIIIIWAYLYFIFLVHLSVTQAM